ncbi:MAG: glycerol-3-phosphate 1-O-acyltransferase PlsY [bacterium]|nr:glycerol-3-phosphate 1-O-acyltransferase PlsY [bacterium]
MNPTLLLLAVFLLGSIPFSYLAVRVRTGSDLRQVGSRNPGATNALRTAGPVVALFGLMLDIGKGFVPIWLGRSAGLSDGILAAAAVACVLGHVFSPFLGFRGGKGVATGFGALSALNPIASLIAVAIFAAAVAVWRIVSLGSILAVAALPLLWVLPEQWGYPLAAGRMGWLAAAVVCGLVLVRHTTNFRRLRAGTESRLGGRPV